MNFATLKGLTIPEGKVTKITDASGRVLWSASTPFTAIIDFGAVTTGETKNSLGYYTLINPITLDPAPAGYDSCTHMMLNGEMYELTCNNATIPIKSTLYKPVDDCSLVQINITGATNVVGMMFKEFGTYNVQLGVLA